MLTGSQENGSRQGGGPLACVTTRPGLEGDQTQGFSHTGPPPPSSITPIYCFLFNSFFRKWALMVDTTFLLALSTEPLSSTVLLNRVLKAPESIVNGLLHY